MYCNIVVVVVVAVVSIGVVILVVDVVVVVVVVVSSDAFVALVVDLEDAVGVVVGAIVIVVFFHLQHCHYYHLGLPHPPHCPFCFCLPLPMWSKTSSFRILLLDNRSPKTFSPNQLHSLYTK